MLEILYKQNLIITIVVDSNIFWKMYKNVTNTNTWLLYRWKAFWIILYQK